jgi:hypothetical protein
MRSTPTTSRRSRSGSALGLAAILMLGCASGAGSHSPDGGAATRSSAAAGASGLPQCLRAYGARFLNSRGDGVAAARRARSLPTTRVSRIGDLTLVLWESRAARVVHRLYLLRPGRYRRGTPRATIMRRAIRLVERLAAHPQQSSSAVALLGEGSRAQTRRLDRHCLR